MAARLRLTHQEDIRAKIQVAVLIERCHAFAIGKIDEKTGEPLKMSELQVNVAKFLIGKGLADPPQQSWVSGPDDEPLPPGTVIFQGVEPAKKSDA